MKYYLLSDNTDTKTGMRLAGVEGRLVHGEAEFRKAFSDAVSDKSIAVLLITQKLKALAPELIEEHKSGSALPLIVEISDRHGSLKPDNYILDYVKDAIGISTEKPKEA